MVLGRAAVSRVASADAWSLDFELALRAFPEFGASRKLRIYLPAERLDRRARGRVIRSILEQALQTGQAIRCAALGNIVEDEDGIGYEIHLKGLLCLEVQLLSETSGDGVNSTSSATTQRQ